MELHLNVGAEKIHLIEKGNWSDRLEMWLSLPVDQMPLAISPGSDATLLAWLRPIFADSWHALSTSQTYNHSCALKLGLLNSLKIKEVKAARK